jgi:phosphoglucosamine mutase
MSSRLFGTDGVRGTANVDPLTVGTCVRLGRSAAHVFRRGPHRHRILIGKDTRLSGYMLENALVAGICSMGVDALLVGPLPTPGIAYVTRSLRADAGIVISASHNPYQDNGIKFFSGDGFKLPDGLELEIEDLTFTGRIDDIRPTQESIGKAKRIDDATGRYVEFVKSSFPRGSTLEGMRIVVDCAHGAGYKVGPWVFRELGAEVVALGTEPDGTNINSGCGSLHPELAAERVLATGADLGVCLDGDADRCILIDERGELVDGDQVMAMCGRVWMEQGRLSTGTIVATVMSNYGLEKSLNEAGVEVVRTQVGDRHVVERMRAEGHEIGGEQSGHMVFLSHTTTGDGLITALQVLSVMLCKGLPLSELAGWMQPMPQVLENVEVEDRRPLDELPAVQQAIEAAETDLAGQGRVLVRYSGTQLLARVMVEGQDHEHIKGLADGIVAAIRRSLA